MSYVRALWTSIAARFRKRPVWLGRKLLFARSLRVNGFIIRVR